MSSAVRHSTLVVIGSFPFQGKTWLISSIFSKSCFRWTSKGFCSLCQNDNVFTLELCICLFALTKRLNVSLVCGPLQILPTSLLGKNKIQFQTYFNYSPREYDVPFFFHFVSFQGIVFFLWGHFWLSFFSFSLHVTKTSLNAASLFSKIWQRERERAKAGATARGHTDPSTATKSNDIFDYIYVWLSSAQP